MTQKIALEKKSELDYYFEELRDKSINFNILNWWKVNSAKYPVILIMAHDILAILVFIIAFESVFSTGRRVLDQYKSSLKYEIAEVLSVSTGRVSQIKSAAIKKLKTLIESKVNA